MSKSISATQCYFQLRDTIATGNEMGVWEDHEAEVIIDQLQGVFDEDLFSDDPYKKNFDHAFTWSETTDGQLFWETVHQQCIDNHVYTDLQYNYPGGHGLWGDVGAIDVEVEEEIVLMEDEPDIPMAPPIHPHMPWKKVVLGKKTAVKEDPNDERPIL